MAYMKQKTDWDCSPTVLANIIEWCGYAKFFGREAEDYYEASLVACKSDVDGTDWDTFEEALDHMASICKVSILTKTLNTDLITAHLEMGQACLLSHVEIWEDEPEWHDSLWIWSKWGWYLGINVKAGQKFFLCRKKYFDKIVTGSLQNESAECYLLRKGKESGENRELQRVAKTIIQDIKKCITAPFQRLS